MKTRPTGVIPPMTTPFRKDGEIDFKLVAPQVDWLLDAGSHGMAAGGSTGEGHALDHEEYRDLIAATVEAALGAHGSIAAILTAAPHASVALWDAVKAGDHVRALDLHKKLLTLWNAVIADNLPACTRYAQILQGLPQTFPRAPMPEASAVQQMAIRKALEGLGALAGKRVEAAE
jgi:dihydrodipicolinate synthase/N-acetylneuraminate lyase